MNNQLCLSGPPFCLLDEQVHVLFGECFAVYSLT